MREASGATIIGAMSAEAYSTIALSVDDDGVAHLQLRREAQANAMDLAMARDLRHAAVELLRDRGVRAVLVTSQGPVFCAGGDLKSFAGIGTPEERAKVIEHHKAALKEFALAERWNEKPSREARFHRCIGDLLERVEKKRRRKSALKVARTNPRTFDAINQQIEDRKKQMRSSEYYFDYNTVELVLLTCSIFFCIAGM